MNDKEIISNSYKSKKAMMEFSSLFAVYPGHILMNPYLVGQ